MHVLVKEERSIDPQGRGSLFLPPIHFSRKIVSPPTKSFTSSFICVLKFLTNPSNPPAATHSQDALKIVEGLRFWDAKAPLADLFELFERLYNRTKLALLGYDNHADLLKHFKTLSNSPI